MKRHILDNDKYIGWCYQELSRGVPEELMIPETDTVLISPKGEIKIVSRGTTHPGYSDVESIEYAPDKIADGNGGWIPRNKTNLSLMP